MFHQVYILNLPHIFETQDHIIFTSYLKTNFSCFLWANWLISEINSSLENKQTNKQQKNIVWIPWVFNNKFVLLAQASSVYLLDFQHLYLCTDTKILSIFLTTTIRIKRKQLSCSVLVARNCIRFLK